MRAFFALLERDFLLGFRGGGSAWLPLLFLVAVSVALPFAIGPDLNLLARIGGAFLWLGCLLSMFLTLDQLLKDDAQDGTLDVLEVSGFSAFEMVISKILIQWLLVGLPLSVMSFIMGITYNLDGHFLAVLCGTLALGSFGLACIGALGASLMVSLSNSSLLLTLIIMPFSLPYLIFGVSALEAYATDFPRFLVSLKVLASLVAFGFVVSVLAGGKALESRS